MTPLIIASLSLHIALIAAFPIQAVRDVKLNSQQSSVPHDQIATRWSRQDIFTPVSVCVAIIGIFIGVLVASPAVRKWLYTPFHCKLLQMSESM
jgi:cell division protein FtsX